MGTSETRRFSTAAVRSARTRAAASSSPTRAAWPRAGKARSQYGGSTRTPSASATSTDAGGTLRMPRKNVAGEGT